MLGGVGLAFLLSMATQGWAFQTSGQRLAERVRISMFGNMLRNGWTDTDRVVIILHHPFKTIVKHS